MGIVKHESSSEGNVFADLTVDGTDNLRIRALLMMEIEQFITREGLTQESAADLMQTTQPYVSDLINGRIERIAIDRLATMRAAAGLSVTVTVKNTASQDYSTSPPALDVHFYFTHPTVRGSAVATK